MKKTCLAARVFMYFFGFVLLITSEGFSADTVLFGLNVPLSGIYAKQGEDQLKAYKLAIKILNEKGGVLGRKIVYSVKDTKTKGKVARKNAKELIKEGAIMITGGSSSVAAIAQCEECQQAGVVFMAALSHSDATSGSRAHRHCFRWYNNTHQTAKALTYALTDAFGKQEKYAYLYSGLTWGQNVEKAMRNVFEGFGCPTVLSLPTKFGSKNYIPQLLQIQKAKPDTLVVIQFGIDFINCLKQIDQLKLRKDMSIVVPLMEINMAQPLGPEIMQNIITSMPWYHTLSEKYEGSKRFVEHFEKVYDKKPGNSAAVAWVNIFQYADAVERAGSFDHIKVIKALEGHKFKLLYEEEYWREWDHQGVHPIYVAIGKKPSQSNNEWDLFEIIEEYFGETVVRNRNENPINLEPLTE